VEKELKLNILDKKRKALLPLLKEFKNEFYLAGGTALALQLGHRNSFDFDFFALNEFNLTNLQKKAVSLFKNYKLNILQLENDTFTILINDAIKISFFKIAHKPITSLIESECFYICNELEIGAMKISALLRAAYRDYVDIYFLLKKYKLEEMINLCKRKYPSFEVSVYLKALASYEDIVITPIIFSAGYEREPKEIFSFIKNQTKRYVAKYAR
jgi:hypothetical protein